MRLRGKVAIVTGASRGIGKAIALRLAAEGADVVVAATNVQLIEETAHEIEAKGVRAKAVRVDVTRAEETKRLVEETSEAFGRVDILVNNAGITKDGLLVRLAEADWDQVLAVNLKGAFLVSKACARVMMRQKSGTIINISSVVGLMGNPGQVNYVAAKAGLIGFTKACARELAPFGITVNAVAPGFIETEMTQKLPEKVREGLVGLIPLGRTGAPEEVAGVVAFLASDEARYLTGQVVQVDGGLLM